MAESHVISALVNKKAELLGLIEYHQKEIKKLNEVITHLNASIKAFDPNYNLSSTQPKQFRAKNHIFDRGELSILIFEVLREAVDPLTTDQIAQKIKEKKHLQNELGIKNLLNSLAYQVKKGNLKRQIQYGKPFWSIK